MLAASALPPRVIAYAADMFALYVGAFAYEESRMPRTGVAEQLGAYFASLPPEQFPTLTRLAGDLTAGDRGRALRVRARPARPRPGGDGTQ